MRSVRRATHRCRSEHSLYGVPRNVSSVRGDNRLQERRRHPAALLLDLQAVGRDTEHVLPLREAP
jgi:hypothetical protein